MLNRFKYFVVFVFISTIGLFLRPVLFGFDSYAWKQLVFSGWSVGLKANPLAWRFIELLPANLLILKLVMFVSLLLCCWFIFLLVKDFFDERTAWFSIFFLLALSPMMLFEFGKFENELFAYPFIVFGIYCFLEKKWFEGISSFTASLVFWFWPFYLTFFGGNVLEQQLFSGLLPLFGLLLVVPLMFLSKNKGILFGSVVSLGLFLFNAKFFIFFVPFLSLGIGQLIKIIDSNKNIKDFVIPLAVILLICWNIAFFFASPTIQELEIISQSVSLQKELEIPIYNDWSYGYWLLDAGYDSGIYGGGEDTNYFEKEKPFLALTMQDLSALGCEPTSPGFFSLTRSMKTWKCK